MNITLRKANALQNAIQDHAKSIDVKTQVSLNEFQAAAAEIATARDGLVANDRRRAKLTQALYSIRAAVGRANADSGVSDLLSKTAYIDKRLSQLKGLVESDPAEAVTVVDGKLEKIRNDKSERRMYGYNDTVNTGVLTAEQISDYKKEMQDLKKEKQAINDRVLELNIRTEIVLDNDLLSLLQSEQLV